MKPLSRILMEGQDNGLLFWCPGCDAPHQIWHGVGQGQRWGWNGSVERPTFTPSVLVQWQEGSPPCTDLEMAEKIRSGEIVQTMVSKVCHSFVTEGKIQFLSDCTHELAGQTVAIPEWESA